MAVAQCNTYSTFVIPLQNDVMLAAASSNYNLSSGGVVDKN